jgi:RNase H-like domain found in reverse transcriptase
MIITEPTEEERIAFKRIQDAFNSPSFLAHFNRRLVLYMDLNAYAKGFGVIVYHAEDWDAENTTPIPREKIKPILFLSKLLTTAESKYGPSELEIACLVWTVRRIRHMIEAAKRTIVYTDHASNVSIVLQTTLRTANMDKLNPRLIRASQYLSQFTLDVK